MSPYSYFKTIFLLFFLLSTSASQNKIIYQEPLPDAEYVNVKNNIILGFDKQITLNEREAINCISVTGSKSRIHDGNVKICNDSKKIIYFPNTPFEAGEMVTVKISGKLLKSISKGIGNYEYSFRTSSKKAYLDPLKHLEDMLGPAANLEETNELFVVPPLTVLVNNNPSNGSIFLSTLTFPSYLIITDKNGSLFWAREKNTNIWDFKKQPNGNLTYCVSADYKHFEIDKGYNVVDTYYCGNGFNADPHELRVLNNGHALLMAYDPQTIDMSQIVQGGNPNATVVGLVIQEIDENNNVVFQWRSWDHFSITDALHENLLGAYIDYVHGNAIEIDNDNNLMISSRSLDEITKISRTTGNIIWRLGGINNQFTFINDTLGFYSQHAIRRIQNGNITIFDNGNYRSPQFSRVIEYSLDEINKTATLVWQYRRTPDVFSSFMGYAQRLDNGNTLIGWGGTTPTVTEVTPAGTKAFEMTFQQSSVASYRAYKFDWNGSPLSNNNKQGKIPSSFKLFQNYPNPFNPVTSITYDIPKASYVELSVFDITGKELIKLAAEYMLAGSYTASFDASQYSSGLYLCRLKAGGFTDSKKMILIK